MIAIMDRNEMNDKKLVDKLTKLKAAIMTKNLHDYSKVADRVYNFIEEWQGRLDNIDQSLIDRKKTLSGGLKLSYIVLTVKDLFPSHYYPLIEHLCDQLESLQENPRRQVA